MTHGRELVFDTATIRLRLARNIRERRILRSLLRLADKIEKELDGSLAGVPRQGDRSCAYAVDDLKGVA